MRRLASTLHRFITLGLVTFGVGALAAACSGGAKSFRTDAYYHERYPVRIAFPQGTLQPVAFERWQLDNYQRDRKGKLAGRKRGPKYEGEMSFDLNDDGIFETSEEYPIYELLFHHRHSNGELWLSTLPLSRMLAEKDLRVLVESYLDGVAGTGSAVVLSLAGQPAAVTARRFATRVFDIRDVVIDGLPGLAATFDVANVDPMQLSPTTRWLRAKLVFFRPGFQFTVGLNQAKAAISSWPVLVIAGYSNGVAEFERDLADFGQFLGNIDVLLDEEAARVYAKPLLDCVRADSFALSVDVNGAGEPISRSTGTTKPCVLQNVTSMKFAALGVPRRVQVTLTRANSSIGRSKGYFEQAPVAYTSVPATFPALGSASAVPNGPAVPAVGSASAAPNGSASPAPAQ